MVSIGTLIGGMKGRKRRPSAVLVFWDVMQ